MHPQTLDIKEFSSDEEAKAAGYSVKLTGEEANELTGMNRKQRRAWLSQQRKAGNK